jgi:hypothetical protein
MNLKDSHFKYVATLKNEQGIELEALELFPALQEISFSSREFDAYQDCIKSCKTFMDELAKTINSKTENRFKVGAEVNPAHTNTPTLSKDWEVGEISRLWIYDKAMEGTGMIAAICKSSIVALPKSELRISN